MRAGASGLPRRRGEGELAAVDGAGAGQGESPMCEGARAGDGQSQDTFLD